MAENDRRGPSTFAFDVRAPVQGGIEQGGGYRGANIVGGNSIASDQSPEGRNPSNTGAVFGAFIDNLMKPAAERKARENFIKGLTDQMYAEAGHEIRVGNSFLSNIFGPTAYEEGAIFYDTKTKVGQAQLEWQRDEGELRKLPPSEVAKAWSQKMEQAKTGDPFADDAIQQQMLEASPAMLQSVAKARYKYQQEQTVINQQNAWSVGAAALQEQGLSFAKTTAPTEAEATAYRSAVDNLAASMVQPFGQEDESFLKSMSSQYAAMIQNGQGHAATALRERGVLKVLPLEQQIKLEDQYAKYGKRAIAEAATHPEIIAKINEVEGLLAYGKLDPISAVKEYKGINEALKRATGFDIDYLDADDQENALKGVWSARAAADRRDEERGYQESREEAREDREAEKDRLKAETAAAAAVTAAQSNNPAAAIAAGAATETDVQAVVYRSLESGDYKTVAHNFRYGVTSPVAKSEINNTIASNVYAGYSPAFKSLHERFNGLMKQDPATAKEYFGDQYPAMLNYNRQLASGATPDVAFGLAFSDDIKYTADGREVDQSNKKIAEWAVENGQPGIMSRIFAGETKLNASGVRELANAIGRTVAVDGKFGGAALSEETQRKTALSQVRTNGVFEKADRLGWTNRPGTKPLYSLLGMQPGEGGKVVAITVDAFLKRAGFEKGIYADEYRIERSRRDGQEILQVIPVDEDGVLDLKHVAIVPFNSIRDIANVYRQAKSGETPTYQSRADKAQEARIKGGVLRTPRKPNAAETRQNEQERNRRLYSGTLNPK